MPKTLRLTKQEEKDLTDKCVELNKLLIMKGKTPVRDSELAHFILKEVKKIKADKNGDLYIDL